MLHLRKRSGHLLRVGANLVNDCIPDCVACNDKNPSQYMVSFSGQTYHDGCCRFDTGSAAEGIKYGSGTLGTYQLDQDPSNPCIYRYDGTGPTVDRYDAAYWDAANGIWVCGNYVASYNNLLITLTLSSIYGYTLEARIYGASDLFDATQTWDGTCRWNGRIFTNEITTVTPCDGTPIDGGQATVTAV